ncbi:CU044_5270 family protein [Streptosporangium amethystogenes]|uniref:CU044_5270 family protein n=1 Tax=Streptosporangium amethystogenes TaxID=2002 RepID=UPI00378D9F1E
MKFATTSTRPLTAIGVGLASVGFIALSCPPSTPHLRLAATTRSVTSPAEGAYWHTRTLWKSTHPRQLGSGSNRYWVEEQRISENWTSPDGRNWHAYRELGTRPKSAADEKAWRRDGSPARWSRTAEGTTVSLSTKPSKGRVSLTKGPAVFYVADQQLSYEELQRLPADPAGLRSWIERAVRVPRAEPDAKVPEDAVDGQVTRVLTELLHMVPVPKEVRVAAYRALPTMPGVRSLGKVKDTLGRTGEGFSIDHTQPRQKDPKIVATSHVIIDTGTMSLLAKELKSTRGGKPFLNKTWTETMLQVGWTDDKPSVPALP